VNETALTYDSANRPARAWEELRDLLQRRELVYELVARNIKVRYKRTILGVVWSMASPLAMMIVLTSVFASVFRASTPAYGAYLLPGLFLWNFFAQTTTVITAEVAAGVDLWRRVRVPKTAFAVATTMTGLVHLSIALVPLAAIVLWQGRRLGLALVSIPVVLAATAAFVLGLGLLLSAIAVDFPDISDILQIILSAWMFATPVMYPREILPPNVRALLGWNPMAYYVEAFRAPLYRNAVADGTTLTVILVAGAATLALGWTAFTKVSDDSIRRR
jgi:ABC-type polysaccharide/polyol phosphate export permease